MKILEHQVILFVIMLIRSSERIFYPMRYAGHLIDLILIYSLHKGRQLWFSAHTHMFSLSRVHDFVTSESLKISFHNIQI